MIGLARKTEGLTFVNRGQVVLKGLLAPVTVLQVAPAGELPDELPPLQPILVTHPTNLPDDPTPFIGREGEIDQVAGLLRDPHIRMVTLTGPGGTGKTRLALQVGNTLLFDFTHGVFICDVAPLNDPALLPFTIARVLGIKDEPGRPLVETLAEALEEKHLLLILDNVEHLIDASSSVVASLLAACRELHVLVTSRIPLHLSREHEYPVHPLSVPDPTHLPDAELVTRYDAVALFVERAGAVKPGFGVTNENAAAVAEICHRLDGLPLAIELAAARIKLFPPQALLQRLSSRLKLLTGGARDRPNRQQTLRNAIDWSYSLLSPEEQVLFAEFSVFAGGCTFEAAEAVCNSDGGFDLLDEMTSLVDKSLLRQEGDEEPRVSMLETIREYAAEKLADSGEHADLKSRHAEHFLSLARSANLTTEDEGTMRHDLVIRDRDNLRAAIEWARDSGQIELALCLTVALENYWVTNSPGEGQHWLRDLLEQLEELPGVLRAHALRCYANNAMALGEIEEGFRFYEQSGLEYLRLGDRRGVGIVLQRLGNALLRSGETKRGRALVEDSLSLHETIGFKKGVSVSLGILASYQHGAGDEEVKLALYERSISLAQESGFVWWHTAMLLDFAEFLIERGQISEADACVRRALPLCMRMGDRPNTAFALAVLARLAGDMGEPERAGRLWGAIEAEEARAPIPGWEEERDAYAGLVRAYSGPEFERGRGQGHRLSLAEAVENALNPPGD